MNWDISTAENWDISSAEGMANAIRWTEAHLARVRDGGAWIVPRSRSIYRVEHDTRSVVRISGGDSAVERVLHKMGWRVRVRRAPSPTVFDPHTQKGII